MGVISNKYNFSLLFDVQNGNPNGDPDSGNMPRIDPETGRGLVTDVCLKRKIRDYVSLACEGEPGYAMYITSGRSLNRADLDALVARGILPKDTPLADMEKALQEYKKKNPADAAQLIKEAACTMYYDVRTFGAVMTGYQGAGASQIRGPVQMGFAQSVDPICQVEVAITRCVHATERDQAEKEGTGTMGRKYIVPYGLYRADGYISAALAEKNSRLTGAGFSDKDLELLWNAMLNMFEEDRSASRGNMAVRKLVIFRHASKMGNAPSHKLFELVHCAKKSDVEFPRSFRDYTFSVDSDAASRMGVTVTVEG